MYRVCSTLEVEMYALCFLIVATCTVLVLVADLWVSLGNSDRQILHYSYMIMPNYTLGRRGSTYCPPTKAQNQIVDIWICMYKCICRSRKNKNSFVLLVETKQAIHIDRWKMQDSILGTKDLFQCSQAMCILLQIKPQLQDTLKTLHSLLGNTVGCDPRFSVLQPPHCVLCSWDYCCRPFF